MNKSGLNTIWLKQIKPKEMMKLIKEKPVQPSIVLPTVQLVAQAEMELKCQQNEALMFAPIKATPEFESTHSSSVTGKGRTTTKRKHKAKEQPKKKKKTTQNKKRSSAHLRDIFN